MSHQIPAMMLHLSCSAPMTVGTPYVAFLYLCENPLPRILACKKSRNFKSFLRRISMVKVQHNRVIFFTIYARMSAKVLQQTTAQSVVTNLVKPVPAFFEPRFPTCPNTDFANRIMAIGKHNVVLRVVPPNVKLVQRLFALTMTAALHFHGNIREEKPAGREQPQ